MGTTNFCNDADERACLDALVKEINDDLTVSCQIPFTVPKKNLANIIDRAKKYFYKIYEYSVEEMYIALPASTFKKPEFRKGINTNNEEISQENLNSSRGIIKMPKKVYAVNNVFEVSRFSGEDGGFGSNSFSSGDTDFSIDKFIYSDTYGAGIGSESLMYYVVDQLFIDNARQALQAQISFNYNRLSGNFRFMGELPKHDVIFQIYSTISDCALFQDEAFIRYCIAQAKVQLSRILGTFNYNLPGNITINYDLIRSEGQDEITGIIEEIKGDEGVDYFFTG